MKAGAAADRLGNQFGRVREQEVAPGDERAVRGSDVSNGISISVCPQNTLRTPVAGRTPAGWKHHHRGARVRQAVGGNLLAWQVPLAIKSPSSPVCFWNTGMATESTPASAPSVYLLWCGMCGRSEGRSPTEVLEHTRSRCGWPHCCGQVMSYFTAAERPDSGDTTLDKPALPGRGDTALDKPSLPRG